MYGSKDGTALISVIPWANVIMFRVRQNEPVVDSGSSQTPLSANVQTLWE